MAGSVETQIRNLFLRYMQNSKLFSELTQLFRISNPDYRISIQQGTNDAQNVNISALRGYVGTFNAATNTATLSDNSTISLSNASGIAGEWVNVTTGGQISLGSGALTVYAGDRLRHDGVKWYVEGQNNASYSPDRLNEDTNVSGTFDIDFYQHETFNLILTGNTTFNPVNVPDDGYYSKVITMYVTGDFALTLPTDWTVNLVGEYDGTVLNQIVVEYIRAGVFWVSINQAG